MDRCNSNKKWFFLWEYWCCYEKSCVCEFVGLKEVWSSAFDFHASDNISSPAGKQFIRPSGVLFNGSLQAETLWRLLCCDRHADHKNISASSLNNALKNNCDKPYSEIYFHCFTVFDTMQMIPLHPDHACKTLKNFMG